MMLRALYSVVKEVCYAGEGSRKGKLPMGSMVCLEAVAGQGMTELAAVMEMSTAGITGMVDVLESMGLVERQPVDGDRRRFQIHRTPAGENAVARMHEAMRRALWEDMAREAVKAFGWKSSEAAAVLEMGPMGPMGRMGPMKKLTLKEKRERDGVHVCDWCRKPVDVMNGDYVTGNAAPERIYFHNACYKKMMGGCRV